LKVIFVTGVWSVSNSQLRHRGAQSCRVLLGPHHGQAQHLGTAHQTLQLLNQPLALVHDPGQPFLHLSPNHKGLLEVQHATNQGALSERQ
jgi:hypothetical protein